MTEQQLRTFIDAVLVQQSDMVQATVAKMLGINTGSVSLLAGTTPIVFSRPYEVGEDWGFLVRKALNADGFDIDCTVSNKTVNGFDIAVGEACTFTYRTEFVKTFITD